MTTGATGYTNPGPTIYTELVQGSNEWVAARCGLLTASVIGKLISPTLKLANNETSRGLLEALVAERLTGHVEYVYPNFDMQRGTQSEPYARDLYREQHGPVEEIGFATNTFNGHVLAASPDGLCGSDGGLEIKSPKPKTHLRTILTDEVPTEHLPQIQASMLVLDREWWDFESYCGGWPIYVHRVYRDETWQRVLIDALELFEENAAAMAATYNAVTVGKPIAPLIDFYAEIEIGL